MSSPPRLAFVGQRTFFEACALAAEHTTFVEFRHGADPAPMLAALDAFAPDVVVAFRPETLPAGVFAGLDVPVLGFLTEPLPRETFTSADLEGRLWWLRQADPGNVDRVVAFDPRVTALAQDLLPVWRTVPLPVADHFYAPLPPAPATPPAPTRPRAMFAGRSTPHRERMLTPAKHRFDLLHLAFGASAARLAALMRDHDVALNVHVDAFRSFENRIPEHLAAGHLVLSEPLEPTHGLRPGEDFVEVRTPTDVERALDLLARHPDAYHPVRVRGRVAAERFRASRVYPRLIADLLADLATFGSPRTRARLW